VLLLGDDAMKELELPGLTVSFLEPESSSGISGCDLNLIVHEVGQDLVTYVRYKSDLFDKSAMAQLLERFKELLKTIVADPDRKLSSLQTIEYLSTANLSTADARSDARPEQN
jgi:non-ribosomal peptide synthetase component F